MNQIAFIRAVLPVAFAKPRTAGLVEAQIGDAISAQVMTEVRARGESPGGTPRRAVWENPEELFPSEGTILAVWGELTQGETTIRRISRSLKLRSGLVFKAINALKARGEVRRSMRTDQTGKRFQVWRLNPPNRGRSAPHVAEHEKGKPVTFSHLGERDDLSSPAAPVAPTAAGATSND